MNFHVIGLPHVDMTRDQSWCAYSNKLRRLSSALTERGHTVTVYATDTDADAYFVRCGAKAANNPAKVPPFDPSEPIHRRFNKAVTKALGDWIEPRDFILTVAGNVHQPIAAAFPENMTVEAGVGYSGTFSQYRVFESYAWMHMVYGAQHPEQVMAYPANSMCDAVIPNLFDPEDFPKGRGEGGYYLFMGRLTDMKGWRLAVEVTERLDVPLLIAGQGDPGELPGHCEYVGVVGPDARAALMRSAVATFVPTQYCEPFGGVHVESMMTGTPVITTDWGVFTETVTPNVGRRCRTFRQFCDAARDVASLDRGVIRALAMARYASSVVAEQYERYFERLNMLWGEGFYA